MAAPPSSPYTEADDPVAGPELRALLICPQQNLAGELIRLLRSQDGAAVVHCCTEWPSNTELSRVAHLHSPNVLVLSAEDPDAAASLLESMRKALPGVPIA